MNKHYEILGLKPSASQEEIKDTYQKLSQKFHPDNNDGDKYFSEMFKNYKEAYEVLTNQSQKAKADSVRENQNNDLSHSADKPKDSTPKILKFESDKDSFEEGASIRLSWKTTNVDKVIIKPFGTVENSGTKVFKLKNYDKETLSITLQATNNLVDETITKTIKLNNNIMEFDFATIQEDDKVEVPEKIQEIVEIPEPVWEEPEVYTNSFAPPLAKPTFETMESFFSTDGRLRRSDYLGRAFLLAIPAGISYVILDTSNDDSTIFISGIIMIIVGVISLIQFIKRLHDINISGWLSLLSIIPILGGLFGLVVLFIDGNKGSNQYGEDPKGRF